MLSRETQEILELIQREIVNYKRHQADAATWVTRKAEFQKCLEVSELRMKESDAEIDKLQLKLQQAVLNDRQKYKIEVPTEVSIEVTDQDLVQIGRED